MNQEFFKFHGVVDRTPAAAGLAYEDIDIRVESRTLKGWFIPAAHPENDRTAVLIFHGVGEVVSDWVSVIDYFSAHGIATMIFDYSAFGNSTGDREYSNFRRDGAAALAVFEKKTGPGTRRFVLGYSLGEAIALESLDGVKPSVDGLILISGWRSFRGWLSDTDRVPWCLTWVLPDIFNNEAELKKTTMPVLIVHGARDETMPVAHAQRLSRAAGGRAQLRIVPRLGHTIPLTGELDDFWKPVVQYMIAN